MTFLSLLKSIPKEGDIPPELKRKLDTAANMLLAGREGGYADVPDGDRTDDYDYSSDDDLGENETIEAEEAVTKDRANFDFEPDYDEGDDNSVTLRTGDDQGHLITICRGSRRKVRQTKARLDMIQIRKGRAACQKEVKRLREKFLSETMGELYGKGS